MLFQRYTYMFDRRYNVNKNFGTMLDTVSYPFLCGFQTRIRRTTQHQCMDEVGTAAACNANQFAP